MSTRINAEQPGDHTVGAGAGRNADLIVVWLAI